MLQKLLKKQERKDTFRYRSIRTEYRRKFISVSVFNLLQPKYIYAREDNLRPNEIDLRARIRQGVLLVVCLDFYDPNTFYPITISKHLSFSILSFRYNRNVYSINPKLIPRVCSCRNLARLASYFVSNREFINNILFSTYVFIDFSI